MTLPLVLSAGHGGQDPGAISPLCRMHEAELTALINWRTLGFMKSTVQAHIIPQYALPDTILYINSLPTPFLAVETHINAFTNPSANGYEVLIHRGSEAGTLAATATELPMSQVFPNRGVKDRLDLGFLRGIKETSIITELGFMTNFADAALLNTSQGLDVICNQYANALYRALQAVESFLLGKEATTPEDNE